MGFWYAQRGAGWPWRDSDLPDWARWLTDPVAPDEPAGVESPIDARCDVWGMSPADADRIAGMHHDLLLTVVETMRLASRQSSTSD